MSAIFMFMGIVLAGARCCSAAFKPARRKCALASLVAAVVVLFVAFTLASFRFVREGQVGIVTKNIGWTSLPPGKIIATNGEKGPQASVLPPGWHPRVLAVHLRHRERAAWSRFPRARSACSRPSDGQPLPDDATYAPEWPDGEEKHMAENAEYFLTDGGGFRGPQSSVLKPGKYRINPEAVQDQDGARTTIAKAEVGVVKSNVGDRVAGEGVGLLVDRGQRGIWREPLTPAQYYLNTDAQQVTVDLHADADRPLHDGSARSAGGGGGDEREIIVRTSDGFTFPVDVRIEYEIKPARRTAVGRVGWRRQRWLAPGDGLARTGHLSQQCRKRQSARLREAAVASGIAVAQDAAGGDEQNRRHDHRRANRRRRQRGNARLALQNANRS